MASEVATAAMPKEPVVDSNMESETTNDDGVLEQQQQQQRFAFLSSYTSNLKSASELLFPDVEDKKMYWDRTHYESPESQMRALSKSSTVYVGNVAFTARTQHVTALFEQVGPIEKINLGLDRFKKSPCGFCFVEFVHREDALSAIRCLSGIMLNGKPVRVELDAGFKPGRQYGRGVTGGQVRDDRRGGRGGGAPAVQRSSNDSYYGRQPPPPTAPHPSTLGEKRGRDNEDQNAMDDPPSKNSRFRAED